MILPVNHGQGSNAARPPGEAGRSTSHVNHILAGRVLVSALSRVRPNSPPRLDKP
jgi:hypothetical protein